LISRIQFVAALFTLDGTGQRFFPVVFHFFISKGNLLEAVFSIIMTQPPVDVKFRSIT
jgi:hypothetical protein